jgi:hypothetical protein
MGIKVSEAVCVCMCVCDVGAFQQTGSEVRHDARLALKRLRSVKRSE